MKKILNPFRGKDGYNCFACSPDNPIGLHLQFMDEGELVSCEWEADDNFTGYTNVLHGGIQSTIMDEIASWTIYVKAGTGGVTSSMNLRFRKPCLITKGAIRVTAEIKDITSRIISVNVKLYDHEGLLCSEGVVDYFVLPVDKAKEKFYYPGKEAFFTPEKK